MDTQEALVARQFGAQADAYLSSIVHAQGDDLATLANLVRARPGCRVLDLGCGGGHVAYAAAEAGGEVVAYDLSAPMLEVVAREAAGRGLSRLSTRQGPADALPFADVEFDLVLSRYSAHHWTDFAAGLREAARVLRPGGTAAFADVVSPGIAVLDTYLQAVEVLRDVSHVRDRSLAEWQETASAAGLLGGGVTTGRLRMEFASWVARMRTPPGLADAVRRLQAGMSDAVRRHFAIEPDGSSTIDVATMLFTHP